MTDRLEALQEFEEAIRKLLEAIEEDRGLVVDWVLVTAQHMVNDNDTTSTHLTWCGPQDQSTYRVDGLVSYVKSRPNALYNYVPRE